MQRRFLAPLALAAAVLMPTQAQAAEVLFSGSMSGPAIVGPDATCGSIPFRGTITGGTGTSPFGNFSYSHNVCTQGPTGGPIVGNYTIDFGADQFFGTLTGASQPSGTANLFNLLIDFTIAGGTGRFQNASGSFVGIGTANTTTRPSVVSLNFSAVPEPATWAMMLLGFGVIGWSRRRRSATSRIAQLA